MPFTPTEDDIIFNFAAVHRTPGHEDHEYFETNIRGAENVVAFAEKWNIKKIVFTSSIAPYGAAEELKKETTLPNPNTAYGISKLVAEKIHEKWQNGDAAHRQLTIVRPGVVFGKGENGNFTRLYWAIRGHKFAYKDVTALRCSEPLRSKVGRASKPFAILCGMGPLGNSSLQYIVYSL